MWGGGGGGGGGGGWGGGGRSEVYNKSISPFTTSLSFTSSYYMEIKSVATNTKTTSKFTCRENTEK